MTLASGGSPISHLWSTSQVVRSSDNQCTHFGGDLFVIKWARVRRVRRGSISSELLLCAGDMHIILLLYLVARFIETIDMHMAHVCFYVCCSDYVGVYGNVCCVAAVVKASVLALEC